MIKSISQPDPVIDALDSLYLPLSRTTELTLEKPWGFSVPEGRVSMYIVLQGGGHYHEEESDSTDIRLFAGDHLIVARGQSHCVVSQDNSPLEEIDDLFNQQNWQLSSAGGATIILCAQFSLEGLMQNPLDIGLPSTIHLNHRREKELADCLPILDLLHSVRRQSRAGWPLTIRKLAELVFLKTLAVELTRRTHSESDSGEFRFRQAITDTVVGPVLKLLLDKPGDPWTVPMMARIAKISKSTFSERFRCLVGQTPLQYLTDVRMKKACWLLRESTIEITNIATLVGYETPSSFSNAFRRWKGVSPAEYRRAENILPPAY